MNQKRFLLPKMAADNIRKNGSTYFPYVGISIFAMFTYFVFDLILKNDIMRTLPKGTYALVLVEIGFVLLGIIMIPFLYYTNSFLIKRRKRELGLYSILGMEKKHIGIMMFWESVVVYVAVIASAILLGLLFSRLIFLLLLNLARMPVDVSFAVNPGAVVDALVFYAFISVLNLLVNLVQVGKANPVELMGDARKGEKEPRHIGLWSILGLAAVGYGYYMAITAKVDSMIFVGFFGAVFLVVIGTYFLFTSGSISFLRLVKRNKALYYRAENFITVSGMLYRMKKSAASLSNICIFSTMVIITVVCSVSVYLGTDSIVRSFYPKDFQVDFVGHEVVDRDGLQEQIVSLARDARVEVSDYVDYAYVECTAHLQEGEFSIDPALDWDYENWYRTRLMTLAEYNRMEGAQETLGVGEVLMYSTGLDFGRDRVSFAGEDFAVKEELMECRIARKVNMGSFDASYVVVAADEAELERIAGLLGMDAASSWSYRCRFNHQGETADVDRFSESLRAYVSSLPGFAQYRDNREDMKDAVSMYGSLLFIGIFFGSIFLICLLVIMYYKQITEGYEDRKNFEIMQKVGMSDEEIRRTIGTQVRMVFLLPLFGALLHSAVGMKMVLMLLGSIQFHEPGLLFTCALVTGLVFAVLYGICYKRTSAVYYRIVKKA